MRNNSKTKHVEKLIIISRNKNNNYNSNDNDLKDKQNHRFKRKEILISTRSWSGLCAFLKYKHYTKISLKQWLGEKINKLKKQWDI